MDVQYSELRPTSGWDLLASLRHPCKFQCVSLLGIVTAQQSSSGHQPNFAALNRGRHLYSAGRPWRWALAHILVFVVYLKANATVEDNGHVPASSPAQQHSVRRYEICWSILCCFIVAGWLNSSLACYRPDVLLPPNWQCQSTGKVWSNPFFTSWTHGTVFSRICQVAPHIQEQATITLGCIRAAVVVFDANNSNSDNKNLWCCQETCQPESSPVTIGLGLTLTLTLTHFWICLCMADVFQLPWFMLFVC